MFGPQILGGHIQRICEPLAIAHPQRRGIEVGQPPLFETSKLSVIQNLLQLVPGLTL